MSTAMYLTPTVYATMTDDYDMDDAAVTTTDVDYDLTTMCERGKVREFRKLYEPPLYCVIVLLGALGNLLVIWMYLHFKSRLKTMTDVFLLNLAFADILFLGTLPFWAADAIQGWTFGLALCKVTSAVYKINFFSSMLLLTCISIDRYIVIVQTTKAQNSKKRHLMCSKLMCVFVWLLAILLALPELIFAQNKVDIDQNQFCTMVYTPNENNRIKIMVLALQICMGFCVPLFIMTFCYAVIIHTLLKTKNFQKHKALRVIFSVVAVFVLSQLPYNSMLVFEATQAANVTVTDCDQLQSFDIVTQIMKSIAYTHCCLNPFLYAFVGVRFRRDVIKLLRSHGCVRSPSKHSKKSSSYRASVMSDTETTQALSL
ncbi:C-C chemokine receptor type 9a [Chanos chanos]|uniref:C-C chemokine receptor type 9a n=1 Tax=Chanos chanos TaxID=29144 RepID=A0A6J2VGS5_CHACN|nr:C-C chemokine receptor type 9-like [Chanos chanos]